MIDTTFSRTARHASQTGVNSNLDMGLLTDMLALEVIYYKVDLSVCNQFSYILHMK